MNDDYRSFLLRPYVAGNADIIPDTSCEVIEEEYEVSNIYNYSGDVH